MIYSPRLLIILLLALLTVSAGCSASSAGNSGPGSGSPAEAKEYAGAITPKAYIDDTGADAKMPREAAYYGGYHERQGLGSRLDATRWSQGELEAASFIHSAKIYFHFDSATLTADAKDVLRQKAARMKAFPQLHVLVAGHSDERGSDDYNMRLGARRAKAAYDYLISQGVPAARLESTSFGKRFPVASGNDEKSWSLNRRDEFMVSKP